MMVIEQDSHASPPQQKNETPPPACYHGPDPTKQRQAMSHTVKVEFSCATGQGVALLAVLLPALVDTRAYQGCLSVEPYVDQDDPDHVVVWQKWASRSHQEVYLAWRDSTNIGEVLGPLLNAPPSFSHLTPAA